MTFTARAMQMYGPRMHTDGGLVHPWLALLFVVIVGVAIGALVWALLRGTRSHYPMHHMGPAAVDPTLETLRMRFARGEIDTDEYASRAALLHGPPPPPPAG